MTSSFFSGATELHRPPESPQGSGSKMLGLEGHGHDGDTSDRRRPRGIDATDSSGPTPRGRCPLARGRPQWTSRKTGRAGARRGGKPRRPTRGCFGDRRGIRRPALAKCLWLHAQVLADLGRPDMAFEAFAQAVATIRPYLEYEPRAGSRLWRDLEKSYRRLLRKASREPDPEMLTALQELGNGLPPVESVLSKAR